MVKTIQKNNFSLRHGDLFDNITSYINQGHNGCSVLIPHVCNNINAFGAGFAGAVSRHFPIAKENYHLLGKQISNIYFYDSISYEHNEPINIIKDLFNNDKTSYNYEDYRHNLFVCNLELCNIKIDNLIT